MKVFVFLLTGFVKKASEKE